ncbi:Choline-sulfatase [Planctomycetes bacterium Poly30]|uniref:Choline-sulfatase n=1 Tax=Saltatorellus ferox TaxID=2528018 RepID=A0A518EXX4_9BACT|nr:Choline-sulfatase [Planctomycetes bacterium Poly30]
MHRTSWTLLLVLLLCLSALGSSGSGQGGEGPPSFLVVVTDDQRFDQMGVAGHSVLKTPTMDGLAARGVRFTESFVTTPICAASRASLMTGRREGRHGYTFGKQPMGKVLADESYSARLRAAGYRTGFVGKWGVRFDDGLRADMFDWCEPMSLPYRKEGKAHLTDRIADRARGFLREVDSEKPFCLTVSFWAPHAEDGHEDQYLPAENLTELYADAVVPVPPLATEGFDVLPEFLQRSLGRRRWTWRFDDREKQIKRTRDYWRLISGVDRALGGILDELEELGHSERTIVVFTSDNGYFLGERGLAGKWLIYEESIRVPLIIVDPRADSARRGVTSAAMALNVDIAPTLLDLAGLVAPSGYDGASLAPWLRGEVPAWREDFLVEHRFDHAEIPKSYGVRGQRWVYALYDEQKPVFEQLFDLEKDPNQLVDRARDPAFHGTLASLRERCDILRGR